MAMRLGPERGDAIPRTALCVRLLLVLLGSPWQTAGDPSSAYPAPDPPRLGLIEAVKFTLENDPLVQMQKKQILVAQGAAESAAGQFDPTFNAGVGSGITRTPLTASQLAQNGLPTNFLVLQQESTTYQMGLNKQLRSGVTLGSSVAITRLTDNGNQEIPANVGQVVFDINVPLLRGLGRTVVDAPEDMARLNAEAAALDLRQITATRVFNTVSAYWSCWAAERQMEVLRESAGRSQRRLDDLNALVRAEEFPAADLAQARADHEEKEADLVADEQQFYDARQALGLTMGLRTGELPGTPLPATHFFAPPEAFETRGILGETLVPRSLQRRSDYQSALKTEQVSALALAVAHDNVRPQLDLNLQAGYTGLDSGGQFRRFPGGLDPWSTPGPNLLGTLRLTFPFGNHAARGLLAQRDAEREQASIHSRDLARNIAAALEGSLMQVEAAVHELQRLDLAVQNCQQAVDNETDKLKLGHSTVVDQITIADRFSNTRIKRILARARYATAVVRVRYESGLLIPADSPLPACITSADLTTPVTFEGRPPPPNR